MENYNRSHKPQFQGWKPSIASIKKALNSIAGVDGIPISLICPDSINRKTLDLFAAGFKQLEGQNPEVVFLVSACSTSLEPSNQTSIIKIYNPDPIGPDNAAISTDPKIIKQLSDKIPACVQFEKKSLPVLYQALAPFLRSVLPNSKFLPLEFIGSNIIELSNALSALSGKKQAVLIAFSKLTPKLLSIMEISKPEILNHFLKSNMGINQEQRSLLPALLAMDFAFRKNGCDYTILRRHESPQIDIPLLTSMYWQYSPPVFNAHQKRALIKLAHDAINSFINKAKPSEIIPEDQEFHRKSGLFVTLRHKGDLRGCIGHIKSDRPLYKITQEMAIAAATSDPRFPAIHPYEVDQITIKISLLSPFKRVSEEEIILGKHGLMIEKEQYRGLFLPEVPLHRSWNKQTFLEALCIKAGLDRSAWKQDAKLYGFTTTEIFCENNGQHSNT